MNLNTIVDTVRQLNSDESVDRLNAHYTTEQIMLDIASVYTELRLLLADNTDIKQSLDKIHKCVKNDILYSDKNRDAKLKSL